MRIDVTQTAREVETRRPLEGKDYGTEGEPVELVTNHYLVAIKPVPCFQYDVDLKVRKRNGDPVPCRGQFNSNVRIIEQMAEEWSDVFRPEGKPLVFFTDGAKYLFSRERLAIDGKPCREVTLTLDGYPKQTFVVGIQFVAQIQLSDISKFYERTEDTQFSFSQVRDVPLQVCDIVSSHSQKLSHVTVGKYLYPTRRDPRDEIRLPNENTIISFGHFQSIVMTEAGLTLNVDRVATAFRSGPEEEPLIEYLKRELKTQSLNTGSLIQNINFLTRKLKDLKIFSKHIKIESPDGEQIPQKRKPQCISSGR